MNVAEEFQQRLLRALYDEPPLTTLRGDDDLNPGFPRIRPDRPPRAAAVLVPLIMRQEGVHVLLTQRPDHMRNHAGQIAFPGGAIDPEDQGPVEAALREVREETGLTADFITPIGFLDGYLTSSHYRVVPVVGLVRPGFVLKPDPAEVADIFEVPFDFLMDASNHTRHAVLWQGQERYCHAMPFGSRFIWGATAGMLHNFHERWRGADHGL